MECCVDNCKNESVFFDTEEGYKNQLDNHMRFFFCEKHKPIIIKKSLVDMWNIKK